ncbi:ATP-grasp domain-containing protein [Myceligenerans pegani]|uniref:ATP-grasp domain-containing protein n=1 Tax=Myceligenerans pegani TaxID=2776917 RepID=A0ABR9N253_9MICO|nr:ATP-grasp domain-containing protein [Myceligenerans sp. TRM 65318]MBE1877737.1 ATP-grasp domain-containing protein [Myceligenerans sp. TRM 65318]MBE3020008.1 ATP-grasp domain-containing protein [Myceligenerans sp. TRM 65318]
MPTLLMIESWLQSTGLSLPPLLRSLGHEYVLVTRDPRVYALPGGGTHPVLAHAAEVVVAETNDDDVVVGAARDVADRHDIHGVLTTCDYYLPTVAVVAEALGLPGSPADALRTATNKHLVRAAVARAGLPDVPHAVAATWEEARAAAGALGYPVVVKPVDLNSGTAVRRVSGEAGLADAFAEVTAPERNTRDQPLARLALLERVLDGPEYSVEAVTRHGVTTVLGITAKSVTEVSRPVAGGADAVGYVESGHDFPAPLDPATRTAITDHVTRVLGAVGYTHGISHTEVRLTTEGPRLVELNPRQGGGYIFELVRLVTGYDPLRVLTDLALGREPAADAPSAGSAAVRFLLAPEDGFLSEITGSGTLADDARVVAHDLPRPGAVLRAADNNDRIGHVVVADRDGDRASDWADEIMAGLTLEVRHDVPLPARS